MIKCTTCEGRGTMVHQGQPTQCWDCHGAGTRPIDDSSLRPMPDPLPAWAKSPMTFICRPCSDEDIVVPINISNQAFDHWVENKIKATCPRCGFFAPRYITKFGHAVSSEWYNMAVVGEDFKKNAQLWREPQKLDRDEFLTSY